MTDHDTTNVEAAAYRARLDGHGAADDEWPAPYELDEPDRRAQFARFAPARDGGWRMMDGGVSYSDLDYDLGDDLRDIGIEPS